MTWRCKNCNAESDDAIEVCWKCGTSRDDETVKTKVDRSRYPSSRRAKKTLLKLLVLLVTISATISLYLFVFHKSHYEKGSAFLKSGNFSEALSELLQVESNSTYYKQARDKISYIHFRNGTVLFDGKAKNPDFIGQPNYGFVNWDSALSEYRQIKTTDTLYEEAQSMINLILGNKALDYEVSVSYLNNVKDLPAIHMYFLEAQKTIETKTKNRDWEISKTFLKFLMQIYNKVVEFHNRVYVEGSTSPVLQECNNHLAELTGISLEMYGKEYDATNKDKDVIDYFNAIDNLIGSIKDRIQNYISLLTGGFRRGLFDDIETYKKLRSQIKERVENNFEKCRRIV